MNPEQQRIAIAEACGWKPDDDGDGTGWKGSWIRQRLIGKKPTFEDGKVISYLIEQNVPDYLNDLNAMHEAESFIRNAQAQMRYASETLIAMGFDDLVESSDLNVDYCWHAMGATAAQRAKAFLKTLNLWKP